MWAFMCRLCEYRLELVLIASKLSKDSLVIKGYHKIFGALASFIYSRASCNSKLEFAGHRFFFSYAVPVKENK